MGLWDSYKMRIRRKRRIIRAARKSFEMSTEVDRTPNIRKNDILLICVLHNERVRLPYFLKYYRDLGVDHFLFVDNGSTDGSGAYLLGQPDVSLWSSKASYKRANFGVDWVNWLARKYAHDHWTLVVDVDEFFVFPFCDTRQIRALTDWLENSSIRSFSAMLLDMYPKGPIDAEPYQEGQNPMEITKWFDSGNYMLSRNPTYGNLWIQGGARARMFFAKEPHRAPALNKIPLVKWNRRYVYVSSTHMLLPRGLNQVYDEWGGEKASGILLHTKFLDTISQKASEALEHGQHYKASQEYTAYAEGLKETPELWCKWSEKYINWRQLEILGLMSKGNWA